MEPGKYIWKTQNGDRPIIVLESLGKINGREYVKIQGSLTGIPLDECVKVKEKNNE